MRTVESLKPLLYMAAVVLGLGVALGVAYLSLHLDQPPHRIVKLLVGATVTVVLVSFPGLVPYMLLLAMPFAAWLPKSPIPFLNTMNILVGIGLLGVLMARATAKHRAPRLPGIWIVIGLFVLILFLSFVRGWVGPPPGYLYPAEARSKALWALIAGLVVFLPFYHFLDNRKAVHRALVLFAVAMALGALGCVYEARGARIGYRVRGGLGDVNDEAAFFAMALCFFLPLLGRGRSFSATAKLLLAGLMGVSTFGLVMPNSRGALISFTAAGLLYIAAARRRLLPAYIIVLALGWVLLPGAVRDRLVGTYSDVVDSGAEYDVMNVKSGGRLDIWKATIDALSGPNAVIGVGYGNLPILVHEEIDAYRNSHNVYLQLWGEAGIAGIGIFLALIAVMLRMAWKLRGRDDPLAAGVGDGMICAVFCLVIVNLFGDRFLSFPLEAFVVFIAAVGARMLFLTEPSTRDGAPLDAPRERVTP